jgi:hypothetical protein
MDSDVNTSGTALIIILCRPGIRVSDEQYESVSSHELDLDAVQYRLREASDPKRHNTVH